MAVVTVTEVTVTVKLLGASSSFCWQGSRQVFHNDYHVCPLFLCPFSHLGGCVALLEASAVLGMSLRGYQELWGDKVLWYIFVILTLLSAYQYRVHFIVSALKYSIVKYSTI